MRIGRHDVIQELGSGGMGIVYKALDPELGRPVAIKMIGNHTLIQATLVAKNLRQVPPGRDVQHRMMLIKEARLANELNHQNIVRVYDYGVHAGLLYIVMECLEGKSLDHLLRRNPPLPLAERVSIVAQMCDGLEFAHKQGVIHRDVKPGNAFVCSDGTVKVLDFGIAAKLAESDGKQNGIAGTINYMPPEMFSGKVGFDARVDIWAAGITLYESVAGRTPFAAPTPGRTAMKIINDPVPPLPRDIPGIEETERILARALAKNPSERYVSAGDFAAELHRLAAELAGTTPSDTSNRAQSVVSQSSPHQARAFAFDIGLSQTKSPVSIGSRKIAARSIMQKLDSANYPAIFVLWFSLVSLLILVNAFVFFGVNFALMVIVYLSLKIVSVPLSFLEYLEALPRCRNCKSWMREMTQWTRFAHTDDAVNLGLSDCVAALEQNLWEDAAKLLFLHGDETSPTITHTIVSPPIRYHLCFLECEPCNHQCARVTIEDKVEEIWTPRVVQFEAYKAGKSSGAPRNVGTRVANVAHSLAAAGRTSIQRLTRYSWLIKVLAAIVVFFILAWLLKVMLSLRLPSRT